MDFVQFITDQRCNLSCTNYIGLLHAKLKEEIPEMPELYADEAEEIYKSHMPLDINQFLKTALKKLRAIKYKKIEVNWKDLDEVYISTFLYYILEGSPYSQNNDSRLFASHIFVLLNTVDEGQCLYYNESYASVLNVLEICKNFPNMHTAIYFLLGDLKIFLRKHTLNSSLYLRTAWMLQKFTFYSREILDEAVEPNNLAKGAFACLTTLCEISKDCPLEIMRLLLHLAWSLNTKYNTGFSKDIVSIQQANVRLFIKNNMPLILASERSLLLRFLSGIVVNGAFDDYEAFARLLYDVPPAIDTNFLESYNKMLLHTSQATRLQVLNFAVAILQYKALHRPHEEIFHGYRNILLKVCLLLSDPNRRIAEKALSVLVKMFPFSITRQILQNAMFKDQYNLNLYKYSYQLVDPTWNKKPINILYIKFICNLILISKEQIELGILENLLNVCVTGAPYDLRSCIPLFFNILTKFHKHYKVTMYILQIFMKLCRHPQDSSSFFVKELYNFLSSHITTDPEDDFIWYIIESLCSNSFNFIEIVGLFHAKGLITCKLYAPVPSLVLLEKKESIIIYSYFRELKQFEKLCLTEFHSYQNIRHIDILMAHKISLHPSREAACKYLWALLHSFKYNNTRFLDSKIKEWATTCNFTNNCLSFIIGSTMKIVATKTPECLNIKDITSYRITQSLLYDCMFRQVLPVDSIPHAIILLSEYCRVLEENEGWHQTIFQHVEEALHEKLRAIRNETFTDDMAVIIDFCYLMNFIELCQASLSKESVNLLRDIIMSRSTNELNTLGYSCLRKVRFLGCIAVYMVNTLTNSSLVIDSFTFMNVLYEVITDPTAKLLLLRCMFDVCNLHLKYYDPILPLLFSALHARCKNTRYTVQGFIGQLIQDDILRLSDGPYYSFMGLFADSDKLILKHMEALINANYKKAYQQTIARHFIPSVIIYNQYYDHPTVSLTESDRRLISMQNCTPEERRLIYCSLFCELQSTTKYNILNNLNDEILVKIINKTLPCSPKVFQILEDALVIILLWLPKIDNIENYKTYYDNGIAAIRDKLEENIPGVCDKPKENMDNILISLLKLLYGNLKSPEIKTHLLFTVLALTEHLQQQLPAYLDRNDQLKTLFHKLPTFYDQIRNQLVGEPLNPFAMPHLFKTNSVEFYNVNRNFSLFTESFP